MDTAPGANQHSDTRLTRGVATMARHTPQDTPDQVGSHLNSIEEGTRNAVSGCRARASAVRGHLQIRRPASTAAGGVDERTSAARHVHLRESLCPATQLGPSPAVSAAGNNAEATRSRQHARSAAVPTAIHTRAGMRSPDRKPGPRGAVRDRTPQALPWATLLEDFITMSGSPVGNIT